MTPDDLKQLIELGPTEQMVAALAPLTEAERKKLSKGVVAIRKELSRRRAERDRRGRLPPPPCPYCGKTLRSPFARQCFECGKNWHDAKEESRPFFSDYWNPDSEVRLKLALLAVGPWTEAQRIHVLDVNPRSAQQKREHLFQVLCDRKPEWLAKWADRELDEEFGDWGFVRRLIRADLCPKPQSENYILKMVRGMYSYDANQSLKDRLLTDPDLLTDEIWGIFELSPVRATIIDSIDISDIPVVRQHRLPCRSWAESLCTLAAEGQLDRQRLLAASLGSLRKNTEARNTTWFAKFHELLEPTADERLILQASYLQLLSHPVAAVVGMALDALGILEKAQKLYAVGFVDGVTTVFHLQPKAQPMSAVKILGRIAAQKNVSPSKIAAALLAGLAHPAAQVQQALVELLGKLHEEAADVIASQLPGLLASLTPSVQEQARKLTGVPVGQALQPDSQAREPDLLEEARHVPSPWREQAGIETVMKALEGTGELTAVAFDPMAVPRLDPAQRVEPIQTLDELIERLTIAVETLDDAIEFELLLDGMSRLCDQRPADFEARIAPLLLRIQKAMPSHLAIPVRLQTSLFGVILRWADRPTPPSPEKGDSILGFLEKRLGLLADRMQKRQAAPLLACPTHRRGWIEAGEMLRRFTWHQEHELEPNTHEVIQALLRLAPDQRAETLARADHLQGKFAPAFRYALGGRLEEAPLSVAVWIAAGRARTPFADLDELHGMGELPGPDAIHAARYSWGLAPFAEGTKLEGARVYVNVEPALPSHDLIRDQPSVLIHNWRVSAGQNRWVGSVWPANPQAFFASGARLRQRDFGQGEILRQRADYLEPLFDPDVPFTEMARFLVALALNQAETEVAGLAVDALIELIRDGRCVGPELGGVLRTLMAAELLKLNRLAKHLETAARASPLHAYVCAQVVQTACSELSDMPKDLHHLLGPLLEWLTAEGQDVRGDFRPILARATTGKAGVLAKRLLNLTFAPERGHRFLIDALEGRLQRVRRWTSFKG